jgi:hypothetical protein
VFIFLSSHFIYPPAFLPERASQIVGVPITAPQQGRPATPLLVPRQGTEALRQKCTTERATRKILRSWAPIGGRAMVLTRWKSHDKHEITVETTARWGRVEGGPSSRCCCANGDGRRLGIEGWLWAKHAPDTRRRGASGLCRRRDRQSRLRKPGNPSLSSAAPKIIIIAISATPVCCQRGPQRARGFPTARTARTAWRAWRAGKATRQRPKRRPTHRAGCGRHCTAKPGRRVAVSRVIAAPRNPENTGSAAACGASSKNNAARGSRPPPGLASSKCKSADRGRCLRESAAGQPAPAAALEQPDCEQPDRAA